MVKAISNLAGCQKQKLLYLSKRSFRNHKRHNFYQLALQDNKKKAGINVFVPEEFSGAKVRFKPVAASKRNKRCNGSIAQTSKRREAIAVHQSLPTSKRLPRRLPNDFDDGRPQAAWRGAGRKTGAVERTGENSRRDRKLLWRGSLDLALVFRPVFVTARPSVQRVQRPCFHQGGWDDGRQTRQTSPCLPVAANKELPPAVSADCVWSFPSHSAGLWSRLHPATLPPMRACPSSLAGARHATPRHARHCVRTAMKKAPHAVKTSCIEPLVSSIN